MSSTRARSSYPKNDPSVYSIVARAERDGARSPRYAGQSRQCSGAFSCRDGRSGGRGLYIIGGCACGCSGRRFRRLARAPSTLALPVTPAWTYLPQMEANACFAEACTQSFAVINCVVTVAGAEKRRLRGAVLEQLAILRKLTGGDPSVSAFRRDSGGYTAHVSAGPTWALMIGRVSPLAQDALQLHAVGTDHRLDVSMNAATPARPAVIRLFGVDGVREAMPIYQSSHRLTWLKVHAFLSGSIPASDLPILNAADVAVAARSGMGPAAAIFSKMRCQTRR
jgi:hypothetical protein